jgi:ABC-type bacteriocin/lantibiotic exporter with double-glycine peptidase domain
MKHMANSDEIKLSPVKRLFRLLRVEKEDIFNIYMYSILYSLINFSLPLGIQSIINLITSGQVTTSWIILILLVLAGIAIGGVFQLKQLTVSEALQQKIFTRAAFEFAYRIPNMRQETLENKHSPELVNRFFDSITIQKGLSKILMDFSGALLMVVLGLLVISFYHPFFIFFSLFVVIYLGVIFFITTKQGLKTSLKESKFKYEVAYWLEEVARTHDVFRYSGKNELHLEKTDELLTGYIGARKAHFKVLRGKYINMIIFKILVAAGLLALGGWLVIDQKMNIGQFVASEIIIILLLNSIEKVILNMEVIYDVLTGLDKLGQVTDMPLEEEAGLKLDDKNTTEGLHIVLNNAGFNYPLEKTKAISNLEFNIVAGSKLNFMGGSGSGRSTLLNILSASFPLSEGNMTINGIPVNNLDIPHLRKKIAVVRSVDQIFKGTIIENISLGSSKPNLEKISGLCERLGLSNFIFQSKDGFNTELLPGGKGIPYSAAYKILIARALYIEPKLFLVDEGFDSLSHKDQEIVADEIFSGMHQFTFLSFSNRRALAEKCSNTVFLEKGKITQVLTYKQAEEKNLFNSFI